MRAWWTRRASRRNGMAVVRIWQANIKKTIIAHVPVTNGQVQETGDFELDGVTFPPPRSCSEFMDPSDEGDDGGGSMFPPAIWWTISKCPASVRSRPR